MALSLSLRRIDVRHNARLAITSETFRPVLEAGQVADFIQNMAELRVLLDDYVNTHIPQHYYVQLKMFGDELPGGPVEGPLVLASQIQSELFFEKVAAALNSNDIIDLLEPSLPFIIDRVLPGNVAIQRLGKYDLRKGFEEFLKNSVCLVFGQILSAWLVFGRGSAGRPRVSEGDF